jgi:hypothetical protein
VALKWAVAVGRKKFEAFKPNFYSKYVVPLLDYGQEINCHFVKTWKSGCTKLARNTSSECMQQKFPRVLELCRANQYYYTTNVGDVIATTWSKLCTRKIESCLLHRHNSFSCPLKSITPDFACKPVQSSQSDCEARVALSSTTFHPLTCMVQEG